MIEFSKVLNKTPTPSPSPLPLPRLLGGAYDDDTTRWYTVSRQRTVA
jgi:hypothetical protein